jgi:uncharacterized phage protein (TIGR01671 family)
MKKEIKFRGKRKDNNQWIYGSLLQRSGRFEILVPVLDYDIHVIKHETVGEFTGLKDKNGVEIFEGDKIKYKNFKGYSKIVFENGAFGYYGFSCFISLSETNTDYIEVIGNVHANPELI